LWFHSLKVAQLLRSAACLHSNQSQSYLNHLVYSFSEALSKCFVLIKPSSAFIKVYRRTLGPVYDNEKENWRILTNIEIYAVVKKPTITETLRLNILRWFGHVQRMEENRIPKKVIYVNLETTRLRGSPRNRWQDEVREDGRLLVEKSGR